MRFLIPCGFIHLNILFIKLSFQNIAPFISTRHNKLSKWFGYFGLGIGVLLLLCSVQLFINIDALLKNKNTKKGGYDYIAVSKAITNENMAKDNSFTSAEFDDLKKQPFIDDASPFTINKFMVKATGGETLPFTADIFLETIDENYIDTIPPSFKWQEGDPVVPVIIGSDYLEIYNTVFAPSQDLPQFSEKTVSNIVIGLQLLGNGTVKNFRANIVALSDRLSTIIVPPSFLNWANKEFTGSSTSAINKILVKTKDVNDPAFLNYIQAHGYKVNRDRTKIGRTKQGLQAIVSGLAGFAVLVIILAMVLFSFYLQLMIARSRENLQLLLLIGYSPGWLSKIVSKKWMPVYLMIVLLALLTTALFQYLFSHFLMKDNENLSLLIDWKVILVAVALLILSVFINYRLIRKLVHRI